MRFHASVTASSVSALHTNDWVIGRELDGFRLELVFVDENLHGALVLVRRDNDVVLELSIGLAYMILADTVVARKLVPVDAIALLIAPPGTCMADNHGRWSRHGGQGLLVGWKVQVMASEAESKLATF